MSGRRGYALLTVIWFLTGSMVIATAAMLVARGHQATTGNRAALIRAEWRAEACVAATRAAMTAVLQRPARSGEPAGADLAPWAFQSEVLAFREVQACPGTVDLEPFGTRADLTTIATPQLRATLEAFGIPADIADSLADTFADWRDSTDAPLDDPDALRFIAGFAEWMRPGAHAGLAALFAVDSQRVLIDAAPSAVLRGLPGMSDIAVEAILRDRASRRTRLHELSAVLGIVPPDERVAIERAFVALSDAATVIAAGWTLRATSSGVDADARADRLTAWIELRLVPEGMRFAITRRRISP